MFVEWQFGKGNRAVVVDRRTVVVLLQCLLDTVYPTCSHLESNTAPDIEVSRLGCGASTQAWEHCAMRGQRTGLGAVRHVGPTHRAGGSTPCGANAQTWGQCAMWRQRIGLGAVRHVGSAHRAGAVW
jgi:hypothetical protein